MSDSCCRALDPGPDEPPPPPPVAAPAPSTPPPTAVSGFQRHLLLWPPLPLQPLTPSPPRRQPPAAAAAAAARDCNDDGDGAGAGGGSKNACTPTPTPPPLPANATTATAAAARPKAPPAVAIRGLLRPLRGPPVALLLSWLWRRLLPVVLLPPSLIRPGQSAMLRSIRLTHP